MDRRIAALAIATLCATQVLAAPEIGAERLLEHIKFLASDDLKGRDTGSEGLQRAADYIAAEFKAAGLQPGWKGQWIQPFDVNIGLTIGDGNTLSIRSGTVEVSLAIGTSYYPLAALPNDNATLPSVDLKDLPVVFAGYGLSVPRLSYDDYADIDVDGKAVLIFSHEPQEQNANSRLNGNRPVPETTLAAKGKVARSRGARPLMVVCDPTHAVDEANYRMFAVDTQAENVGIPVLRLRRDEMKPLLDAWGLEAIAREIDRDLIPRSKPLPGGTVRYVE